MNIPATVLPPEPPWEPSSEPPDTLTHSKLGTPTALWRILDVDGRLFGLHARWDTPDGKEIRWWRNGEWKLGDVKVTDAPLYGSELLRSFNPARPIFLVEGEKCVDALRSIKAQALGTVCGASSTPGTRPLAVFAGRDAVLLHDNDGVGREHMQSNGNALQNSATKLRTLELPGLEKGGDIVDWLEAQSSNGLDVPAVRQAFGELVRKAEPFLAEEPERSATVVAGATASNGGPEAATAKGRIVELISAATIKPERVEYVVEGRVVRGDLGLIVGAPGLGKGAICMDWIARLTCGTLAGDLYGTASSVVIASAEDSPSHFGVEDDSQNLAG